MNEKLTEKQKEVYDFIVSFINKNGYSPSIREICKATNKNSTGTIFTFLETLERKGYIKTARNKNRTITLTNNIKETLIFVDEEDLEERYGKDLYIGYLEEELQAYKEKEDKLREYIDKEINQPFTSVYDYEQGARDNLCQELYKILNEGSD